MNVIRDAADNQGRTLPFFEDAGLVREQSLAMLRWDEGFTVLGAVDEMDQIFRERLRHGN